MNHTLKTSISIGFAATLLTPALWAQNKHKNVLFLMADDFNYWAKCIGYQDAAYTPNIDALAAKGVLFTEAHCSSPVCNPSRNALWSGFRASTTGIEGNADGYVREVAGFANIVTMNQYFMDNGYFTYGAGKLYHSGSMGDVTTDPTHWSQLNTAASGCGGSATITWTNPGWTTMTYKVGGALATTNCNDVTLANNVVALLKGYDKSANKDKPFFIGCGVFRPHLPWNCPKDFWDMVTGEIKIPKGYMAGDLADIGESPESSHTEAVKAGKWLEAIHVYLANCALADYNIGLMIKALETTQYKDNTIICFMGDHGWHLGEKEKWGKNTLYDEANHTTLIIYDPSAKGNGQKCTKVVSLQDLYPTLVELCGLPPKTDIEGRSLAPVLNVPDRNDWDWPVYMRYGGTDYIKTNDWRYIGGSKNQLYNMKNDPYEFTNLLYGSQASNYTAVRSRLIQQMDSITTIGQELKAKLLAGYTYKPANKSVPGLIEAENYDEGANRLTYYDKSTTNTGGANYRSRDAVDIEITNDAAGAFCITGIQDGEWLQYSINDYLPGEYTAQFRVSNSSGSEQKLKVLLNDTVVAEVIIPTTAVNEWTTAKASGIKLNENDRYVLKLAMAGNGFKINNMNWTQTTDADGIKVINDGRDRFITSPVVTDRILKMDLTAANMVLKADFYDMKGRCIKTDYLYGEMNVEYPLDQLFTQGTYIIKFDDTDRQHTEKFVVSK